MPVTLLLLSTADTDLLAARSVPEPAMPLRLANPARTAGVDLDGVALVLVRLLGGRQAWEGLDALLADAAGRGVPVVALGGEGADPELTALSTVPAGVVADAADYLREGGPDNLRELVAFLSDTVLLTGHGFAPAAALPAYGLRAGRTLDPAQPTVGVVYYRAHELSGNTGFVDVLCDAVEAAGANARPVYVPSLRPGPDGRVAAVEELLAGQVDALVVTVLAGGGSNASDAEGWDARALTALDVPVLQGLCVTSSRAEWEASDAGLAPIDAAMQVAIPEFDGRLVGAAFSFKETGEDGVPVYVADPERAARVAGTAVAHARLAHVPNPDKRLALVLSSYPTKHSRVGNAVGLDTPASAVHLLRALREAGYDVADFPEDGDELVHTLIAAGGHDVEWLTEDQLRAAVARVPLAAYQAWFATLPAELRDADARALGPAARQPLRRRRRDRAGGAAVRQRRADDPAAARLRREPDRDLPRPRPAAVAPLPGGLPLAGDGRGGRRLRGARGRAPGQARDARVAARQGARPVRVVRARRGARRPAAVLPVHRQRPG